MQSVSIDGVTYTKANIVAKKFRYTTDYIGQLCRANKADCQLVGRSWFVSEDSLLQHKDTRYKATREAEKTLQNKPEKHIEVKEVKPRLTRAAAKNLGYNVAIRQVPLTPVSYHPDEDSVLPNLRTKIKPIIPVIPASVSVAEDDTTGSAAVQKKVPVKLPSPGVVDLNFSPLPEITLTGTIDVQGFDVSDDTEKEPIALISNVDLHQTSSVAVTIPSRSKVSKNPMLSPVLPSTLTHIQHSAPVTVASFTPKAVSNRPVSLFVVMSVAFVLSLLFSGFLITATQQIVIDGQHSSAVVIFAFPDSLFSTIF